MLTPPLSGPPLPLGGPDSSRPASLGRRSFFRYAGAAAGATALALAGCRKQSATPGIVNVGTGDAGALNYAYALEQLEAAFYTLVRQGSYYAGASAAEKAVLDDLYYHEVIHRDFLHEALIGAQTTPIMALTPDFSSINFNDKAAVLATAQVLEDLGVAAYNGAARYFTKPAYVYLAGKIVSVEARHAAVVRDLVREGSFVGPDVLDGHALEKSLAPSAVAATANQYLAEGSKLDVAGLG